MILNLYEKLKKTSFDNMFTSNLVNSYMKYVVGSKLKGIEMSKKISLHVVVIKLET